MNNYKIVSSNPVTVTINKNLINVVSVFNTRSKKTHVGYEYQNGQVDILTGGMSVCWKTIKAPLLTVVALKR